MNSATFFRIVLMLFCVQLAFPCAAPAQNAQPWDEMEAERDAREEVDEEEMNAQKEMSTSVYGRIVSVNADSKTLSLLPTDEVENTEAEDEDGTAADIYYFKKNSTVTGIASFGELAAGDYVTLDYYTFHGSNRILGIVFDKPGESDEGAEPVSKIPSDLTDMENASPSPQSGSGDLIG